MDPRPFPKLDTRGVHPVMTMAGIMPGGSEMRHWHVRAPFPDPDAIARHLAAGHATTHAELRRQAEFDAAEGRRMELGTCYRLSGECTHDYACVRCPYLHVEDGALPRLLQIEAETELQLARAEADGRDGEVIALADTLTHVIELRNQARAALA